MKLKRIYRKRREALITALTASFPHLRISGDATGLHLITQFPGVSCDDQTLAALEQADVRLYPVSLHTIDKGHHQDKFILGYGHLSLAQIEEGVSRIKSALPLSRF